MYISSLLIKEFEDLDEIVARYIQQMAANVREILNYKYYFDGHGGDREAIEQHLLHDKLKNRMRSPYCFSASQEFPGKFLLSYLPRDKVRHEYVTVMPEGHRYRRQVFHSVTSLLRWFKEHFRDPIPGETPINQTPSDRPMYQMDGMSVRGTPFSNFPGTPGTQGNLTPVPGTPITGPYGPWTNAPRHTPIQQMPGTPYSSYNRQTPNAYAPSQPVGSRYSRNY